MPIGSLIQGIAAAAQATNDLGFGIYNAVSQYRENKRNRQFAQDMAGYQNAVNRANWEAENAYNTPAMELQRMRVAGINPALAMGGNQTLSLAGSNMQPAAAVNVSPLPAPQLSGNPAGSFLQAGFMLAEADKAKAEAEEARSRIPVHEREADSLGKQIEYTEQLIKESEGKVELMKNQGFAALVDASANFQNTMSEIQLRLKQGLLTQKEIDSYDERLQSDLAEARARIQNLKSDSAYKREMVKQIKEDLRQGKIEFASEWGTSDREIEMRVNRMLDEADVKAGIMSRELARSSKNSYRNWKHFAEIWNDFIGPVLSGGADVSDAVSKYTPRKSEKTVIKKFVKG